MAAVGASDHALHRHAEARLILFVSGRYRERAVGESEIFGPGDIIVRPAFYAHDGCALTSDTRYVHFWPRPGAMHAFFAHHGWQARRATYRGDWRDLVLAARDPDAGDMLLSADTNPLALLSRDSLADDVALELSNAEAPRLRDVAEARNISPSDLTRRFALAFGMNPNRYRQHARVQAALRLLAETGASLAQIAAQAGFSDQSHLGRALRAATGCTPNQLRRQLAA